MRSEYTTNLTIKNKREFDWVLELIGKKKELLYGKESELSELFRLCDNDSQRDLLSSLLERFFSVAGVQYGKLLKSMAKYIRERNYDIDKLAIIGFVEKEEPDSSMEVLQCLKVPLAIEFDKSPKIIPHFNEYKNLYNKGFRHFIAVDEFIGTGVTVRNRFNNFNKSKLNDATMDFCVMVGMEGAVNQLKNDSIPVEVLYPLNKGISDFFKGDELKLRQAEMTNIESKLADEIGATKLSKFSFGFLASEALYYKQNGNIPNNVFPVFWWKMYKNGSMRKTLFIRVQDGY